jgi:hypothetical protein
VRAGEDLRKLALSGTFTFGLMLALSSLHNRSECGEIFRTAHTPFRMLLPTPFQERTRLSRSEALPGLQRVLVLRQNDQRDCQVERFQCAAPSFPGAGGALPRRVLT